jgi:sortase A
MKDRRTVDELSIEELEQILRIRKREARVERLRRQGKSTAHAGFDPLAPEPIDVPAPALPTRHQRYRDSGATAQYRARSMDEPPEKDVPARQPKLNIRWDWLRDKSLLVIELGLVITLIVVVLSSLSTLRDVNEVSSQAQALPTLTPTPLVHLAMLPGGHTPPDASGGPQPVEIPAHLRDRVAAVTPMPVPTAGPEHAVRIQIPAIGVDAPVVEGDDWEALKQGAGHHIGSANPGERSNCIISAHNDIFGEIFRDLPDLDIGAEIFVYTPSQVYRYVVSQTRIIEPTEVSVMEPTSSPVLTLISCYPYGVDTHRIVVVADLEP